jgi:tetratricopeptide (TPR) repeat protein
MAEKQTRMGRRLFRIVAGVVLAPLLFSGCSHVNDGLQARTAFREANLLFSQGSYQDSLDRYGQIAADHPLARDRVLFEMGVIHSHPKNGQRDHQKALDCFQELVQGYPDSPYRQNSETMIFTITNVALKDRTIAALQATIETLQQEAREREDDLLALQQQLTALEKKHFAFVLENGRADRILIEKAARRLTLFSKGEVLKTYKIALGGNPVGAKERQGDNKTPEGTYIIDARNRGSSYHLSLHVSYPNEGDKKRARELGVSPGGDIMIHGIKNGYGWVGDAHAEVDWTKGCIAVTDEEIEEIHKLAPLGTTVEIRP